MYNADRQPVNLYLSIESGVGHFLGIHRAGQIRSANLVRRRVNLYL
jgi:hypothetical protein